MSKNKKLYRSQKDYVLGGVCGGIAEYFDVDSILIRLIAIILLFSGAGFLIYIFMWIVIPTEKDDKKHKKTVKLEKDKKTNEYREKEVNNFKEFVGLLLIVLGLLLLMGKIFSISPEMIGISMLIIIGILFLVTSSD
ncbi:PspC domain-containing protein [Patescibacteria group bacterium]|nr:PspC domain-containing protein [Patescibacteria group bacterium]